MPTSSVLSGIFVSTVVGYTVLNIFRFAVKRNIIMYGYARGCRRKACAVRRSYSYQKLCVARTVLRVCLHKIPMCKEKKCNVDNLTENFKMTFLFFLGSFKCTYLHVF